jgi:hypothetical protein
VASSAREQVIANFFPIPATAWIRFDVSQSVIEESTLGLGSRSRLQLLGDFVPEAIEQIKLFVGAKILNMLDYRLCRHACLHATPTL